LRCVVPPCKQVPLQCQCQCQCRGGVGPDGLTRSRVRVVSELERALLFLRCSPVILALLGLAPANIVTRHFLSHSVSKLEVPGPIPQNHTDRPFLAHYDRDPGAVRQEFYELGQRQSGKHFRPFDPGRPGPGVQACYETRQTSSTGRPR
jgi:hypothetical protein